ncbi:hypothetical protein VNO78_19977 [Psophocarpus tetragonolobus]|uniref:Uncharacterized protein n=1 Tax=Psophocarpus tetragonolobus TaxID=3891 RepID=A0AAN9S9K3_PSOTE
MAKDVVTIRNETLNFNGDKNCMENLSGGIEGSMLTDMSSDFHKKVTSTKHDKGDNEAGFLYGNDETYQKMAVGLDLSLSRPLPLLFSTLYIATSTYTRSSSGLVLSIVGTIIAIYHAPTLWNFVSFSTPI